MSKGTDNNRTSIDDFLVQTTHCAPVSKGVLVLFEKRKLRIMAGWHVIEKYLEETGAQSTLVGKYWITMFLGLRLLMLVITEVAFGEDYKANGIIVVRL